MKWDIKASSAKCYKTQIISKMWVGAGKFGQDTFSSLYIVQSSQNNCKS